MTLTRRRKLQLSLMGAFVSAMNLFYASQLNASLYCNTYYCSSANPSVCGSKCGCTIGFPYPQCYGL
jgi:hypothetical protein